MVTFPNAKINLGLDVVSKRPDGYHNLETIFYPIPLEDVLEITVVEDADAPDYTFTMRLNQIDMDAPGEEFDGTVGFKVQDNTLTLTYADMTEVYNKVN